MPMSRHKVFLILILSISFFLRAYRLGSYPLLNPDEAAIAYNAYSLLLTGKDEHGLPYPIHFKSFGDYKPGAYFYFALPFVKIFGLNPLAVRLPNLILSIIGIYFFYRLIFFLSKNLDLSLLSTLLLALSPWHLHFSRGAWESSTALSIIIMGTYYFFKQKYYLFAFFFVLSLYTYHSARIFTPLLALLLFLTNYQLLISNYKKLLLPLLFGVFFTLPVLFSFFHSGGATRFSGVGLTADPGPLWRANELLSQHQLSLFSRFIHNRRILYLFSWLEKYTSHFDLNFLFLSGDDVPRSKVPNMGQLYLCQLPLIIFGLYLLLHKSGFTNLKSLFLPWLLISPLASSLTFQAPSALRALAMSIPLTVFSAVGLLSLPKIPKIILITFCFINFIYYLDAYYVHYPKRFPSAWSAPFQSLTPFIQQYRELPVYITDRYDQPYIMILFYLQYPPSSIQPEIQLSPQDNFGFSTVKHFDRFYFQKINWSEIPTNSLVIASDEAVPQSPLATINFPNHLPAFKIYLK